MLTAPTVYGRHYYRDGEEFHTIVKITNDSGDYYQFSDIDLALNSGAGADHVYPLLVSHSGINQAVDVWSRRSSIANVTITLSNKPFTGGSSGGARERFSDLSTFWSDALGEDGQVDIYLAAGGPSEVTALSDCLLVFSGKLLKRPKFNEDVLIIEVEDIGARLLRTKIPVHNKLDLGYGTSERDYDRGLAIVNGAWSGGSQWGGPPGGIQEGSKLVEAARSSSGVHFSVDHEFKTLYNVWMYFPNGDIWLKVDDPTPTVSTDTTGGVTRSTVIISNSITIKGWAYLSPSGLSNNAWTGAQNQATFTPGRNNMSTPENCWDRDNVTSGLLYAGTGGSPYKNKALAVFEWPDYGLDWTQTSDLEWKFFWRTLANSNVPLVYSAPPYWTTQVVFIHDNNNGNQWFVEGTTIHDGTVRSVILHDSGSTDWDLTTKVGWNLGSNGLIALFPTEASSGPYDIEHLLEIFEVAMVIYVNTGHTLWLRDPRIFLEIDGQEVGSEIATRVGGLDADDLVEWSGHQIERLLRQSFHFTAGQIDDVSLDDAYRAYFRTRTKLEHEAPITLGTVLQELAENGNFVLFFDAGGKTRVVPWDGASPATDQTVRYSDISGLPTISRSDPSKIINHLTAYYDLNPQTGLYEDSSIAENATSQSSYGVKKGEGSFRFYHTPTPGFELPDHLVGGLFAADGLMTEFDSPGIKLSLLQIGDVIELDDEDFDGRLELEGVSWSGKKFRIIGKRIMGNGFNFLALAT